MAYFECINCAHKIHQNSVKSIFSPKCEKCKASLQKKEFIGIPTRKLWQEISALGWKFGRSKMLERIDMAV